MGQNNRQRRAAKQRQRGQGNRGQANRGQGDRGQGDTGRRAGSGHPASGHPASGYPTSDLDQEIFAAGAASLLLGRALRQLAAGNEQSSDLVDFQRCAERHQQAAVDEQVSYAVDTLIASGWTPLDLYEAVRRKTGSRAISHLLDTVAEATARHPAHLVHPQWRAQLDQFGAQARSTGGLSPACDWAQRLGLPWPSALRDLLAVLVVACALPALQPVLPAPGAGSASEPGAAGVDGKVLRRVRALLAKAESTEHPKEADALTAKAQQLMTRYSIERVVAESARPAAAEPTCRRLWLDSPYVDAKSLLVEAVAGANNCRAIQSPAWGFVAIVGHAAELEVVELLTTSLLLQATRAMTVAGTQATRYGSRTRSFRQSFLVAYAGRIRERLADSAHKAERCYDTDNAGVLVPLLTARRELVDDKVAELFPGLVERRVSVSNAAGWGAGRAAADLALFDVHGSITPRAG